MDLGQVGRPLETFQNRFTVTPVTPLTVASVGDARMPALT